MFVLGAGNCKVEIHGGGLRCESTEQELTVSGPRGVKVVVSGTLLRSPEDVEHALYSVSNFNRND